MERIAAILLAAGKGTRMKSALVKVLHQVAGQSMIDYPVATARAAGADPVVLVVGHQGETVQAHFAGDKRIRYAIQAEQLGTGHAVACTREALAGFSGTVLILCGDTPLLRPETLSSLLTTHRASDARITVLTARLENPHGYGRVIRGADGQVLRIVEQKDATPDELAVNEINSGMYCMESTFLFDNIDALGCNNAQQEYYLTDLLAMAVAQGLPCRAQVVDDPDEIMGINDRVQLAAASQIMQERINRGLMVSGVTLIDPVLTYIDAGVIIGSDCIIHPNCRISGATVIGAGTVIDHGVSIADCRIGEKCHIKAASVLEDSELHNDVAVGPMAHLRPGTVLHDHVKIGNFVETKKAVMGKGSKASHLTYLGDAEIGIDVNIGCGTITCNYDGVKKHRTVIGDQVFVGSDVQLVAPVTIGRNSLIAAGTTVTQDVPPDSLALSRTPQVNKEGWRLRKK